MVTTRSDSIPHNPQEQTFYNPGLPNQEFSMKPYLLLLHSVAASAAFLSSNSDPYFTKLKTCLIAEEIFSVHAFLQYQPNLKVHLPEEYYSPQGQKSLDIFLSAKSTAITLSTLIGSKCNAILSKREIIMWKCRIMIGATMLNGYLDGSDHFNFDQQLSGPKAAQYPDLRRNALEELETMINFFAFAKRTVQPDNINVNSYMYILARARLNILESYNKPNRLTLRSYHLPPPTNSDDFVVLKPLWNKTIVAKPLEIISQARELKFMHRHFSSVRTEYCCLRLFFSKQIQLSDAFSKVRTKHVFIYSLLRKELALPSIPDTSPVSQLKFDCFIGITNLSPALKKINELPKFFKLILNNEEFDHISGIFFREDLFLFENMMFPKIPLSSSGKTAQVIAQELLTPEKFALVHDWRWNVMLKFFEIGFVPCTSPDEVEESSRPFASLYLFAQFLIIFIEYDKSQNVKRNVEFARVGLGIVNRFMKYVNDEAWQVRLLVLHESILTLLRQVQ